MKEKLFKIINIILICCILVQTISLLITNNTVYANSSEKIINTVLGDIKVEVEGKGLKKGETITIKISTTAENITSINFYLEYDKEVFETISNSDIETLTGWSVTDCGETPAGEELFFAASSSNYACTNGEIAKVNLKVNKDAKESGLKLNYINIINKDYEDNSSEDEDLPSIEYSLYGVNTYEVQYKANTEDNTVNGMPNNEEKTMGEDYTISTLQPSRSGYKFISWNTKEDGSGTNYYPNGTYNLDEDLILYAQWEKVSEKLYLSTDVYKIGNNDINNYEIGDKYISRINELTTLAQYKNNLKTNGTIKVIKADKTELKETELVGTGMTLIVTKDTEKIELKIVVMGDLDGNGKVTVTDLSTLNQTILRTITLENEYKMAADLDENDKITVTDLSTLNKMLLKII